MNPTAITAQTVVAATQAGVAWGGPRPAANCQAAGFGDILGVLLAAMLPGRLIEPVAVDDGSAKGMPAESPADDGAASGPGSVAGAPVAEVAEGAIALRALGLPRTWLAETAWAAKPAVTGVPADPAGAGNVMAAAPASGAGCDLDPGNVARDADGIAVTVSALDIPELLGAGSEQGLVTSGLVSAADGIGWAWFTRPADNPVDAGLTAALVARLAANPADAGLTATPVARLAANPADAGGLAEAVGPVLDLATGRAPEGDLPQLVEQQLPEPRSSVERPVNHHVRAAVAADVAGGAKAVKALWASAAGQGLTQTSALMVEARAAASPFDGQAAAADGDGDLGPVAEPGAVDAAAGGRDAARTGGGLGASAGQTEGFTTEARTPAGGAPDAGQAAPRFDSALLDAVGAAPAAGDGARPADAPARVSTSAAPQLQQAVFDAIADRLEVARARGENLARFELATADGNSIRVRISVHDNSVSARIGVTSEAMKEALAGNVSELSQRFEAGGLVTETIQVSMLGEWETGAGRHDREKANRPRTGRQEQQVDNLTLIEADQDGFEKWA